MTTLRKPDDNEIDVYGLTHMGKVRTSNQDNFLVCSLRKHMDVLLTSLSPGSVRPAGHERLAVLAMVADGVGGQAGGEQASRLAVETATRYLSESIDVYYTADPGDEEAFSRALSDAALRCHAEVLKRAQEGRGVRNMATTLTVWIGVWPRAYLLQVGDSRYYLLQDDTLTQVSRDQTLAEGLVAQGILSRAEAEESPWANVLASAIGGSATTPVVTAIEQSWGQVHLLCSDGLTKHVSDDRIRERLRSMTSARQVCEDLLQDALDAGGTDNITLIVGRAVRNAGESEGT